jgi:hypothetical protein
MSEKRINKELVAVEAALASLKPSASGTDRDRVMFLAGRASVTVNTLPLQYTKINWLWPCITAVSLLLAISSSSILFLQGTATGIKIAAYFKSDNTQTTKNIPQPLWYEDTQQETPEVKRPRPSSGRDNMPVDYLSLNRLISEKGVEALPGSSWIPIGPDKSPHRNPMLYDDVNVF